MGKGKEFEAGRESIRFRLEGQYENGVVAEEVLEKE